MSFPLSLMLLGAMRGALSPRVRLQSVVLDTRGCGSLAEPQPGCATGNLYGSVDSTTSKVSFEEAADLTFSSSHMWTAL